MDKKNSFSAETSEFYSRPGKKKMYEQMAGTMHTSPEAVFQRLNNLEYFYTQERLHRLTKAATLVLDDLRPYGVANNLYQPSDLIVAPSENFETSEAQGITLLQLGKDAIIHIESQAIAEPFSDPKSLPKINEDRVMETFLHELSHLYNRRVRKTELDGSNDLSRTGLRFHRNAATIWNWVNEAIVTEFSLEEFKKITGRDFTQTNKGSYQEEMEQLLVLKGALARKNKTSLEKVTEIFRTAAFGTGDLNPLRHSLEPQFKSITDFVLMTDAPFNFKISSDLPKELFELLASEIADGKSHSPLQENLAEDNVQFLGFVQYLNKAQGLLNKYSEDQDFSHLRMATSMIINLVEHNAVINILASPDDIKMIDALPEQATKTKPRKFYKLVQAELQLITAYAPYVVLSARYPKIEKFISDGGLAAIEAQKPEAEITFANLYKQQLQIFFKG